MLSMFHKYIHRLVGVVWTLHLKSSFNHRVESVIYLDARIWCNT